MLLDRLLNLAKSSINKDEFVVACELLEIYLKKDRAQINAVILYAGSLDELGRRREAKNFLLRALDFVKPLSKVYIYRELATVCNNYEKGLEAEMWFKRAIKCTRFKGFGWLWTLRGANQLILNNFIKAEEYLKKALKLKDTAKDETHLNLGYTFRARQRYEEANCAFKKALEIDPDYSAAKEALHSIENIASTMTIITKMSESLKQGVDNAKNIDYLYTLSKDQRKDGCLASAAELLQEYLKHRPDHDYAWFLYGDALRLLGRFKESRKALGHALRLAPAKHKSNVRSGLATLGMDSGKNKEADRWFRETAKDPEYIVLDWFWILWGDNYLVLNNFVLAEKCFKQALKSKEVDFVEGYSKLGLSLRAQRKYKTAREAFQAALKIRPSYEEAKKALKSIGDIEFVLKSLGQENNGVKNNGNEKIGTATNSCR